MLDRRPSLSSQGSLPIVLEYMLTNLNSWYKIHSFITNWTKKFILFYYFDI